MIDARTATCDACRIKLTVPARYPLHVSAVARRHGWFVSWPYYTHLSTRRGAIDALCSKCRRAHPLTRPS